MSTGLYQTHFSRSGDVIHPRNCENLGLGTRLLIPWQFNILSCFSLCAIGGKWENRKRGKDICDSFKHNTIPFYILLNIVQTPCMLPTQ